ncbi:MAG: hypothetical protein KC451_03710 [Amylibacter sp.]|jgi:hypothetical protein|nr:hypothetical protein [Amylibacter sp.]
MRLNKKSVLVGLGLVAACSVCLVPLAVPAIVALGGFGLVGTGYAAVGGVVIAVAGVLWFRRHPKSCECC